MQELERRLRIAEISANVQGVNADNFIKFCNTIEGWATVPADEDDPLKLDVPDPSPQDLLDEIDNFKETFWSRPQILIGHNANHGQLVMTSGEHGSWNFTGKLLSKDGSDCGSANSNCWPKSNFTYYGEIEEPKNPGNPEREIDWSRPQLVKVKPGINGEEVVMTNGIHESIDSDYPHFEGTVISSNGGWEVGRFSKSWRKSAFVYHGEIPQEQQEEPKTASLNFLEAVMLAKHQKARITRVEYDVPIYYEPSQSGDFLTCTGSGYAHSLSIEDFLATDWQIIEP